MDLLVITTLGIFISQPPAAPVLGAFVNTGATTATLAVTNVASGDTCYAYMFDYTTGTTGQVAKTLIGSRVGNGAINLTGLPPVTIAGATAYGLAVIFCQIGQAGTGLLSPISILAKPGFFSNATLPVITNCHRTGPTTAEFTVAGLPAATDATLVLYTHASGTIGASFFVGNGTKTITNILNGWAYQFVMVHQINRRNLLGLAYKIKYTLPVAPPGSAGKELFFAGNSGGQLYYTDDDPVADFGGNIEVTIESADIQYSEAEGILKAWLNSYIWLKGADNSQIVYFRWFTDFAIIPEYGTLPGETGADLTLDTVAVQFETALKGASETLRWKLTNDDHLGPFTFDSIEIDFSLLGAVK